MAGHPDAIASALLDRYGRTYADDAGIRLADKPAPLYQLLVLATLLSARISADIAIQAARELFAAGYKTPDAMQKARWQERVDALGRAHYRRYDERTSTMLGDGAALLNERWQGDLRKLRDEAGGQGNGHGQKIASLLQEFPGIGPAGADIFLREVQAVWPSVPPYVDARVQQGAREVGLPTDPTALAELAGSNEKLARLCAALVRITLSKDAVAEVKEAAQGASLARVRPGAALNRPASRQDPGATHRSSSRLPGPFGSKNLSSSSIRASSATAALLISSSRGLSYPVGRSHGLTDRRVRGPLAMGSSRPTTPISSRMTPTTFIFRPGMALGVTANHKIAPTAIRVRPVPVVNIRRRTVGPGPGGPGGPGALITRRRTAGARSDGPGLPRVLTGSPRQ